MTVISAASTATGNAALRILARNRLLYALILGHLGLTLIAGEIAHQPFSLGLFAQLSYLFAVLLPFFLVLYVARRFVHLLRHHRGARPIHWLANDLWSSLKNVEQLAEGVVTMLMLTLFTACYGFFKGIIPALVPFSWDESFAHLDKVLHGGVQPFAWLLPIFGNPYVLSGLNAAYQAWFLVMFLMVFIAAFSTRDRAARQTFLCAFVLIWGLGGNLAATLLSSAGPCYYAQLGFGHTYDALTTALAKANEVAPIWSLNVQKMLWDGYTGAGPVEGISAMPSMHVASTAALTLYAFRHNRWLGYAFVLFEISIMLAAVLLAWHYAVDVYAGFACAHLCWWLARRLTGDRLPRGGAAQQALA